MASSALPITEQQFILRWLLGLAFPLAVVAVSAVSRRRAGKPIFMPPFPDARFRETWRSGRSHRGLFSRLGRANHCLWVVVTGDELRVGPHFPFNLGFLPDFFGLEYWIKCRDIVAVEQRPRLLGRPWVWVRFRRGDGAEEAFEVGVTDAEAFYRALYAAAAAA